LERAWQDFRGRLEEEFRRAVAQGVESALAERRRIPSGPLSIEEQNLHLRAQRFARVKTAEIQLYHAEKLNRGRSVQNIYEALRTEIDQARAAYRDQFLTDGSTLTDYLHEEVVRTLAHENRVLLGPDYPGPLA
jgi:hypothetical protein